MKKTQKKKYGSFSKAPDMKYILVCGSGLSGIGKGVCISSIGSILQGCGYKVTIVKIDPYLVPPSPNPPEHRRRDHVAHRARRGLRPERWVSNPTSLTPSGEVDLDLGNYERYFGINLSRHHNITTGKVYNSVIR